MASVGGIEVPDPVETPDTTPAQILSLVVAVIGLAVGFGLIDNDHAQILVSAASIIVPTAIVLGDSIIRHGRAKVAAAHVANAYAASMAPPPYKRPDTAVD